MLWGIKNYLLLFFCIFLHDEIIMIHLDFLYLFFIQMVSKLKEKDYDIFILVCGGVGCFSVS